MLKRLGLCCVLIVIVVSSAYALADTPQSAGRDVRQFLFEAQRALMEDDLEMASASAALAREAYTSALRPSFDINIASALDSAFDRAESAIEQDNIGQLAASRGQIWSGVMYGSTTVVLDALEQGDAETARLWLPLRDFRAATRFSRPGVDATLAIDQLARGQIDADKALQAVRVDLLDTYQAQLYQSLADADQAAEQGFDSRRAEESGLAAGYFDILAPSYAEQRGETLLGTTRAVFTTLVDSALVVDDIAFTNARTAIDAAISGFRAAPLSDAELARRAGQFLRFIQLVPVEYGRGVYNGVVTNSIEIQEARTFHEGATAAFADLSSVLPTDSAARITALLNEVGGQIDAVAEPSALESTINDMSQLALEVFPAEWQSVNGDADTDVILSILDQIETAVEQDQYALAESARLEAYALLELGMEQRLRGFAPELSIQIESLFWQGTPDQDGLAALLGTQAPVESVKSSLNALRASFDEAQTVLGSGVSAPLAVAGNAAVIVFREGLEGVLILASLLASLRTAEERRYRRPLVAGSALAFFATGVTWLIADRLLVTLLPLGERLEAVVSLIAIGVLLLITNWFFHKVYWTGWMANFHSQKRRIIGGFAVLTISQSVSLILLGFTSVYREGFETVLFLQSLVLEAGIGVVMQGVVLGLIGVAIVGFITFRLQVKLPYRQMLVVTGVMIGAVLLVMVGNTVHVMQSVGWLPITPIAGVRLPFWLGQWFGLFATWQGIGLQIAAAVFVIGSYFLAEHQTRTRRRRAVEQTA